MRVEIATNNSNPICVVCLQPRQSTWIFLPCRHANCCGDCSRMIEQLEQSCPTCRTPIDSRLQIFLNSLKFSSSAVSWLSQLLIITKQLNFLVSDYLIKKKICAELIEELARATDLKFGMHVEHVVSRNKTKEAISPLISEKGDKMSWPIRFEDLI